MSKTPVFLLLLTLSSFSQAASKNLCDELKESGSSPEAIQKCWDNPKYGKSDYAKQKEVEDAAKKDATEKKDEDTTKKKSNIEIKKFTEADLEESGFGKPFFAIRIDRRYGMYKEKRITTGDALCNYLGYEKALKSKVSPEFFVDRAGNLLTDKKGLVIDTNILGQPSSEAELYRDEDHRYTIRKYVEISCAKRIDKSLDTKNEILKSVTEDLVLLNETINQGKDQSQTGNVNNDKRGNKPSDNSSTPHGYKSPFEEEQKSIGK